ncbi:hypothetical protein [Streptomyces erythrochromogenes]|uniref:hypothetical protein n=1 Tax=Streptomyces erythrochromogenes TaxID=285574 RepID=UPI0027E2DCCF|nr:hypothetical protein [Streptomyces erythrochromogenes]
MDALALPRLVGGADQQFLDAHGAPVPGGAGGGEAGRVLGKPVREQEFPARRLMCGAGAAEELGGGTAGGNGRTGGSPGLSSALLRASTAGI